MATYTPGVRQRAIAKRLTAWRERSKLTRAEVAKRAGWSASKQTRLEAPSQEITPAEVMTVALVLDVPEDERTALFNRAQASMTPGWWDRIEQGAVTDDFRDYIELEADARRLRVFQLDVVHGLFQERDYGIEQGRRTVPEPDEAVLISGVEARIRRQARLNDEDFSLEAVFAESILHNGLLPSAVMRAQRRKLIELAGLPGIELRILPSDGASPPVGTGFSILSFGGAEDPDVGYIELPGGGVFLEDKEKVDLFGAAFSRLWGTPENQGLALDAKESLELIASIDA